MALYYRDNSRKSLSLMSCVELFEEHDIVQGYIRTRIQLICMFVNVRDCVRQLFFLSLAHCKHVRKKVYIYCDLSMLVVTIYGRGFGFILIILLLVGFYIQKSYVRFSYTFDRLDF